MPNYYLQISDGVEAETIIDVPSSHEAINAALNALSQFACKHFPPPELIEITVAKADRTPIATLKFGFTIEYGAGVIL